MQDQNNNQTDQNSDSQQKSQSLPATNQQIAQDLPTPQGDTAPLGVEAPSSASDSDLIEKEWVEKAKEIVSKTQSNPYKQQEELTKMKADYLKKRYNREMRPLDE